jgi:hypothetical protein
MWRCLLRVELKIGFDKPKFNLRASAPTISLPRPTGCGSFKICMNFVTVAAESF